MDYLVPTALEIPNIEVKHLVTPSPFTVGGFKGMGEGGTIAPPAAILNGVVDALSPLGVKLSETPLTPERIWGAIQKAQSVVGV
jgi:carbon-monoxide dehydrogenase large subunit